MRKNVKWWLNGGWLVVVCLALIGCATNGGSSMTPQVAAPQTREQLLSAAGFKQVFPTTPAQKAKLANMPQKQVFLISQGSKVYYVYADANGCGCLYAGNQRNYQKFQQLAADSQMIAEQYAAAQMNDWDWYGWGPGGWGVGETGEPE